MSRPLIFRRALAVLRQSSPIDDFSGFVQCSEFAGLSIDDVEILACLYDNAKNDLFTLIICPDDSFTLDACADLASSVG